VFVDLVLDPAGVSAGSLIETARIAEGVGFDGVWVYDHMSGVALARDSIHDPWPILGAIAAVTSILMLGPLVTNMTVRRPAHAANAAATLQSLSAGRVLMGVGAGAGPGDPFSRELDMIGEQPKPAAQRRLEVVDAIAVMRSLWAGGGNYAGDSSVLHDAVGFGLADPPPPIIVGANGPKMCEIAGLHGDGVNLHSHETRLADLIGIVRASAGSGEPIITVEAPMDDHWIGGEGHSQLAELGIDRLILEWHGATDDIDRLVEAGRLLSR
jgi:alkanesulfonate monooxygenase SsuD/methylene tetrahydromethanopterin reductase-like flavin-dependent oxidoreductase (luciferase family)